MINIPCLQAAVVAILSVFLHYYVHGSNATNLELRYEPVDTDEDASPTSKVEEETTESEELVGVPPSLELSVFPAAVMPV